MLKGLLSWSSLVDSAGRRVSSYRLRFDEGFLDWRGQIIGMGAEGIWTFFMLVSTLTTTLLGWVSDPKWLDSLESGYRNLTETAFGIVNPIYVAVGAFVILMVYIMVDTAKSTNLKFTKAEINRVTAGVVIMVIVAVMVANPFMLLNEALSLAGSLVEVVTGNSQTQVTATTVDAMIRQPTLIINYGGAVSDACATRWSSTGDLTSASGCFQAGADSPTFSTVVLALLALLVALSAMVFTIVSLWKFTLHLSVAVIGVISLPWVAAFTIAKRRQFDGMGKTVARIGGHLIMAVVTQIITVAGPAMVAQFLSGWGQTDWAIVQMFLLALSWIALTAILVFVTRKSGGLVRGLRADATQTLNNYLGSPGAGYFGDANSFGADMRSSYSDARSRITSAAKTINESRAGRYIKGKAADALSRGGGKAIMEDLKDVQSVQSFKPPAVTAMSTVLALPVGTSPARTRMLPSAQGSAPQNPRAPRPPYGGGGGSGFDSVTTPDGTEVLVGAPSADALRGAYESGQARDYYPQFGGLTPESVREEIIEGVVRDAMDAMQRSVREGMYGMEQSTREGMDEAQRSTRDGMDEMQRAVRDGMDEVEWSTRDGMSEVERVTSEGMGAMERVARAQAEEVSYATRSGMEEIRAEMRRGMQEIATQVTPTEALYRAEHSRGVRAAAELSRMSDGGARDDMRSVQGTVSALRQAVEGGMTAAYPHIRNAVSEGVGNSLRGGAATRGDVGATTVTTLALRADSQVASIATAMRERALGNNVVVAVPLDDAAFDLLITSDNPSALVNLRVGVGFGDRIR